MKMGGWDKEQALRRQRRYLECDLAALRREYHLLKVKIDDVQRAIWNVDDALMEMAWRE